MCKKYWNAEGNIQILEHLKNVQDETSVFGCLVGNEIFDRDGLYIAELVETTDRCRVMVNKEKEIHKYDHIQELPDKQLLFLSDISINGPYTKVPLEDGYRDLKKEDIKNAHKFFRKQNP